MNDFASKLKNLRTDKGLTQLQLASQLNITKSMVSAYETGTRYPSFDIFIKISYIFHVTTDYLLGIGNRYALDISDLTDNQITILLSLISEFKK